MLNERQRIGILFLGCGCATRLHSRTLRRIGGVDLIYASREYERAEELRRQYAGRAAFASYEAGLADPAVDVALIATPPSTHYDLAILALDAGKHVIVEKPAFLHSSDIEEVIDVAESRGCQVFVAENYHYKPIAQRLRCAIGEGQLGDVRFVTLNAIKRRDWNGWRGDPSLSGGGALFEAGVHWISFASNLGLEVTEIHAYRVGPEAPPDRSSLVTLRYANGAVGTLAHSWELAAPFGGLRLSKVQGTRGAVTFESNGFGLVQTGRRRSVWLPITGDALGYRAMMQDFLGALRRASSPRFTVEMARRDLILLEAAEASMGSGAAMTRAL